MGHPNHDRASNEATAALALTTRAGPSTTGCLHSTSHRILQRSHSPSHRHQRVAVAEPRSDCRYSPLPILPPDQYPRWRRSAADPADPCRQTIVRPNAGRACRADTRPRIGSLSRGGCAAATCAALPDCFDTAHPRSRRSLVGHPSAGSLSSEYPQQACARPSRRSRRKDRRRVQGQNDG